MFVFISEIMVTNHNVNLESGQQIILKISGKKPQQQTNRQKALFYEFIVIVATSDTVIEIVWYF